MCDLIIRLINELVVFFRIINILPELREETDQLMIPSDQEVIRKFNTCLPLGRVNFNSKVVEYDLQFKKLITEYAIPMEPITKVSSCLYLL